jgi:hypothetical protein
VKTYYWYFALCCGTVKSTGQRCGNNKAEKMDNIPEGLPLLTFIEFYTAECRFLQKSQLFGKIVHFLRRAFTSILHLNHLIFPL